MRSLIGEPPCFSSDNLGFLGSVLAISGRFTTNADSEPGTMGDAIESFLMAGLVMGGVIVVVVVVVVCGCCCILGV